MASDLEFADFIADQMAGAGEITYRKMFGEFAIYCDGKVVALVCDNQLFMKPTPGGRGFIGNPVEGFPYPGAKPWLLIADAFEDREWLAELIRITAREIPIGKKPRSTKRKRRK